MTAFGEANVLSSYDCDPVDPGNPIWIHTDWFLRQRPRTIHPFKVVHGHLPIRKYDLVPSALRIVMLREPVENLISIYYYWRGLFDTPVRGHAIYEFAKRERLSLLDLAEIPKLRRLMSESYFGGVDMRRFDVIGTYDRRAQFVDAVSGQIGTSLSAGKRENVTPSLDERGEATADAKLIAKLRNLLQDDIRFYEAHADGRKRSWLWKSCFFSARRTACR